MPWLLILAFSAYLLVFRAAAEAWGRRWEKYSKQPASCGLSGEDVARLLLAAAKVEDIRVVRGRAAESARFEGRGKKILLGPAVYEGRSVAAVALAAQAVVEALPGLRSNPGGAWRRWVVMFGRGGAGLAVIGMAVLCVFTRLPFRTVIYVWLGCALVLLLGHGLTLGWEYQVSAEAAKRLRQQGWIRRDEEEAFEEMRKAVPLRDVLGIGAALRRAFSSLVPMKGWK